MTADEAEPLLTGVGFPFDGRDELTLSTGGSDTLLDVEVTSNRSDCLSHLGWAWPARRRRRPAGRSYPGLHVAESGGRSRQSELASVSCSEPALCPLYTTRVITGVKIGPSPRWLVERIEGAGLRPVNNVVDITNFVLLELGQPLHAFDLARLDGREIIVRVPSRANASPRSTARNMSFRQDARHRRRGQTGCGRGCDGRAGQRSHRPDDGHPAGVRDLEPLRPCASARQRAGERFELPLRARGSSRKAWSGRNQRAARLIVELAGGQLAV
ncbi:MAG: phenylalanine--tRNA ligase beta subunit-related protein [Phycisphaerales bacterium]